MKRKKKDSKRSRESIFPLPFNFVVVTLLTKGSLMQQPEITVIQLVRSE